MINPSPCTPPAAGTSTPGPDFQQATVTFGDGERRRGDVEIHRYASGWTAHRHHHDSRYNNVMLHVFLWHDRKDRVVMRADGQAIPQVALENCLPRPLLTYRTDVVLEDYPRKNVPLPGRCYEALRRLEPGAGACLSGPCRRRTATATHVAMGAAGVRSGSGTDDVRGGAAGTGLDGTPAAFPGTGPRRFLAGSAGLPRRRAGTARAGWRPEALLLGVAGLLPDLDHAGRFDDATQRYVEDLYAYWARIPRCRPTACLAYGQLASTQRAPGQQPRTPSGGAWPACWTPATARR